jgi:hypothetical protein
MEKPKECVTLELDSKLNSISKAITTARGLN